MLYRSPDLDAFATGVTRTDLAKAGALLRFAVTPSGRADVPWLFAHVAEICASQGARAALLWLDGFHYATGVRHHDAVCNIQVILTLSEA